MASQEKEEMSFWDHLDVLRGTLFRSAVVVVGLAVLFFIFKGLVFKVVFAPTKPDFIIYRLMGMDVDFKMINVDITAQFMTHMNIAFIGGIVVGAPYILFELWRFIAPALYDNEKKKVSKAFLLASGLFFLGVLVGYFLLLPLCINFFLDYSVSDEIVNTISLNSYTSMFTSIMLSMGLAFEFPVLIALLSIIGIVNKKMLKKYRKYALVAVMVLAAFLTPADPLSLIIVTIPLYALYEFSIILCK